MTGPRTKGYVDDSFNLRRGHVNIGRRRVMSACLLVLSSYKSVHFLRNRDEVLPYRAMPRKLLATWGRRVNL
jgi:hypothetical protein